ncbi:hypothetical protein Y032_0066g3738 [Ancylostoma ceylanicum]|nr:hypothetical protein Y032_0066g3738 [Ancylostoma ceylanicum]
MIYFSCWPTTGFVDNLGPSISLGHDVNLKDVAFIGLSVLHLSTFALALFVEALVLVLVLGCVGSHCAIGIHLCLKRNSFSVQSKRMQQQMFTMLLFESACPAFCLHVPLASIYVLVFTGIASPSTMSYMIGLLMASYPLFCPLVVVLVMKEYRRFFCRIFGLQTSRNSSSATIIVDGRTTKTTVK